MRSTTLELTSKQTADEIEELARYDRSQGVQYPTTIVADVPQRIIDQIDGLNGVVLTSADGAVFIGELSDWDDTRREITVELH